MAQGVEHIEHTIEPVFDERSEVLVLGTMPSTKSREVEFYYGHPQNRFWRVLAALFDEPVPENNDERIDLLLRHHIALWDVLASCDIQGASDASIENPVPNDLNRILKSAPIKKVFCTGATSARLYQQLCEAGAGIAAEKLPSTSPANAAWSLDRLVEAYEPLKRAANVAPPVVLDVPDVVELEKTIAAHGTSLEVLMRRAGRFLAYETRKLYETQPFDAQKKPVVIFCGNGNNGGDGWVAGEYLDAWGIPVTIITAKQPEDLTAEPARTAALRASHALSAASAVVVNPSAEEIAATLDNAALIIDAILGTGFSHDTVRTPFDMWIRAINEAHSRKSPAQASGTPVVAADVPSGLSAQTGKTASDAVYADFTVTMIVSKPGLQTSDVAPYCGTVKVAPIAYIEPFL